MNQLASVQPWKSRTPQTKQKKNCVLIRHTRHNLRRFEKSVVHSEMTLVRAEPLHEIDRYLALAPAAKTSRKSEVRSIFNSRKPTPGLNQRKYWTRLSTCSNRIALSTGASSRRTRGCIQTTCGLADGENLRSISIIDRGIAVRALALISHVLFGVLGSRQHEIISSTGVQITRLRIAVTAHHLERTLQLYEPSMKEYCLPPIASIW